MFSLDNKDIVMFGTGSFLKNNWSILQSLHPIYFWDNNEALTNTELYSLPIKKPSLKQADANLFIIIVSSAYKEIHTQLTELGYSYNEDFITFYDYANYINHTLIPNGHFYSPVPNMRELFLDNKKRYERSTELLGIDMNLQTQQHYFELFKQNVHEFHAGWFERFHLNNNYYEDADALALYTMYKEKKPAAVIEVGSGFTSALFLDMKQHLQTKTDFTFIEPYPDRLLSLLDKEQMQSTTIYERTVQEILPTVFDQLDANDFLFIDSSHVSKYESDVNYLFFEIFPRLKKGVIIHLHDIFHDLEYPAHWISSEHRFWNEAYILRAFLQFNDSFKIMFSNNYMLNKYKDASLEKITDMGGSIWIEKIK